jgi:hypothetical protein
MDLIIAGCIFAILGLFAVSALVCHTLRKKPGYRRRGKDSSYIGPARRCTDPKKEVTPIWVHSFVDGNPTPINIVWKPHLDVKMAAINQKQENQNQGI